MLLFDIEKVCRTKYSPKNKYFFASFNKDRWLSLNDKTKDYNNRNTGGQVNSLHEVTQLRQYSGWKYAYLSARTKNIISRKLKYIFTKKHTTTIRTYWATKYESRRENEFWATCHNISNLFDGCWHPLLSSDRTRDVIGWKSVLYQSTKQESCAQAVTPSAKFCYVPPFPGLLFSFFSLIESEFSE